MKVNENAKCPYCGHEGSYIFHLGVETLWCNKCKNEFIISVETKVVITSSKLKYKCPCEHVNEYESSYEDDANKTFKCEKCGTKVTLQEINKYYVW